MSSAAAPGHAGGARDPEQLADLRRAAFGAAYRMLGVHADAEEAAQEAIARLLVAEPAPDSPRSWIVAVSTRLSIDRLRSARSRREAYIGPWLPEPLLRAMGPAEEAELAESVSLALMVVLETLSPAERAAFLLHDVFGYGHGEVAATLERSEPAARQLVSRARRAVREGRVRFEPDPDKRAQVAWAFARACGDGDLDALVQVLAADVVMRTDGGGVAQAARRPLVGADRVARALVALRRHHAKQPMLKAVQMNGTPGMLIYEDGRPATLMGVDVAGGQVVAIHVVREPGKLAASIARLEQPG